MRQKLFFISLLLTLLTIAAYWPVTGNQFIAYDDQLYVTENPNVIAGLSWNGIYWAFTSFDAANWHPLTWLSHQFDVTVFGLNSGAHHAVNLLLHSANVLLLVFLLVRLTGAFWRSVMVAGIFALHPLHVESVAWLAERKDLLCAFFFFLTLHAYLRYIRLAQRHCLLPVVLFFALSLMSKPMTVTLPVILLLLDWWPLQRFSTVPSRTILLEKTPLIVLSVASCIVTLLAQKSGGAVIAIEKLNIPERLANALSSYVVYIRKMVWPLDLALLYPLPSSLSLQATVISTVIIIIVTLAGFHLRKSRPYLLVGWLWYLVMLIPVIGLVQVGIQSNADRYTYLPMIGLTIAVVWGLHSLFGNLRHGYVFLKVLAACMMLMFVFMTRQQVLVWRDSETLFRHALSVTRNNYVMHMNLGITLWNKGKQNEAIDEYRKAIKICPTYADLHFGLANFLLVQGNIVEAAEEYRTTLKLRPDYPFAHTNLGLALQESGQIEDAIVQFKEGLRLVPGDYKASDNLLILLNR